MRRFFAVSLVGLVSVGSARAADVHVGIEIGVPAPPPIVVSAPPQLVVVPGVPTVQYAPDLGVNFFFYGGSYYTYHGGAWFVSAAYGGPWTYVEHVHVPRPLYAVPHRCFHGAPPHYVAYREYHGHPRHPHGMPPGQAKKYYGRDVRWHEHEHGHHEHR
jgi:hypothetical protein